MTMIPRNTEGESCDIANDPRWVRIITATGRLMAIFGILF